MAERAGAAMHIHLFMRQAELAHRRHHDDGEGLVDLEEIDARERPADALARACAWRRSARSETDCGGPACVA